jgi:polysaccharide export outer membrane protein
MYHAHPTTARMVRSAHAPGRAASLRGSGRRCTGAIIGALAVAAVMAVTPAAAQERSVSDSVRRAEVPIGLGDKVVLRVWREPTWSDAFPVDPSGDVVLPRIGRMRVAGMMPSALEDSVRIRLATYLREPNVDLIVLRRVAVLGSVKKPDVLFVEPVTTLQDVIAQAGGLSEDGDVNRIEILRGGERVPVGRWRDVASRPATDIRSGDQIVVGRKNWLSRNALAAVSSIAVAASVLLSAIAR